MINKLETAEYSKVERLFDETSININCIAVLNGDNDGTIWVNDLTNPTSAFMVDNEFTMYLVGNTKNSQFNQEIGEIIRQEIFPPAGKKNDEWVIYYRHPEWETIIEPDFKLVDFFLLRRCFYVFENLKIANWREKIPENFEMKNIKDILDQKNLVNYDQISKVLNSEWRSEDDFKKREFGYALVKNNEEIITRAMADYVTGTIGELGIWTDECYRRKGFASISVAACVEESQHRGLSLRWHHSEHNVASLKTAEKVGFILKENYTAILGYFDEYQNLIENSWYKGLYLNEPETGLEYVNRAIEMRKPELSLLSIQANILVRMMNYLGVVDTFYEIIKLELEDPDRFFINFCLDKDFTEVHKLKEWSEFEKKFKLKYPNLISD